MILGIAPGAMGFQARTGCAGRSFPAPRRRKKARPKGVFTMRCAQISVSGAMVSYANTPDKKTNRGNGTRPSPLNISYLTALAKWAAQAAQGPGLRAGPRNERSEFWARCNTRAACDRPARFRQRRNDGRKPGKGRVCERSPGMSAANFGREATHAQRVTGLPGFAEGEMGGASRTRAETSLLLS